MAAKYVLNPRSNTLHIIGKCRHTQHPIDKFWEKYNRLDDVVAQKGEYYKKCKLCFENE